MTIMKQKLKDRDIVAGCKADKPQSQRLLYEKYCRLVMGMALRYTQNISDAEDVTQDVFVKIFMNIHTLRDENTLTTWIKTITTHTSLDFLKARNNPKSKSSIKEGILLIDFGSSTVDLTYYSTHHTEKPIDDGGAECGASNVEIRITDELKRTEPKIQEAIDANPSAATAVLLAVREAKEKYYSFDGEDMEISISLTKLTGGAVMGAIEKYYSDDEIIKILSEYIGEIRTCFEQYRDRYLTNMPIKMIFLTGGASRMQFIQDLARDVFHYEGEFYREINPSLTISNGIALAGRADLRSSDLKGVLDKDIDEIGNQNKFPNKVIEAGSKEIANCVLDVIEKRYELFKSRTADSSLESLESEIKEALSGMDYTAVFNKPFGETIPDTIAWSFGSDDWHTVASVENVTMLMQDEKSFAIHADSLLDKVFTGDAKNIYQGSFRYHYTYMDKETGQMTQLNLDGLAIEDRIGAILVDKPIVKPVGELMNKLTVYISEATQVGVLNGAQFLEFKDRAGEVVNPMLLSVVSVTPSRNSNYYDVLFQKKDESMVLPEVGFMVRLIPGVLPDLRGNVPHVDNPWLRIEGEQRVGVESPGVVAINPVDWTPGKWPHRGDVAPVRVDVSKKIDDVVAETGLPGELIKFDLSEVGKSLLMNSNGSRDSVLAKAKIKWEVEYFSTLGQFVNSQSGVVACNDKNVFGTDCVENPGNVFLMWDAHTNKGRWVGTGVYIAKLKFKIFQDDKIVGKTDETFNLGVRRHEKR